MRWRYLDRELHGLGVAAWQDRPPACAPSAGRRPSCGQMVASWSGPLSVESMGGALTTVLSRRVDFGFLSQPWLRPRIASGSVARIFASACFFSLDPRRPQRAIWRWWRGRPAGRAEILRNPSALNSRRRARSIPQASMPDTLRPSKAPSSPSDASAPERGPARDRPIFNDPRKGLPLWSLSFGRLNSSNCHQSQLVPWR